MNKPGDDRFDLMMVDIEQKCFDVNMLMSGFIFEVLGSLEGKSSKVKIDLPYYTFNKGYSLFPVSAISLDNETGEIVIYSSDENSCISWNDLDLGAKGNLILELHQQYKKLNILHSLSGSGNQDVH